MAVHSSLDSSSSFEWNDYLSKTNGRPASGNCFKQYLIPPKNLFEVSSLLEAEDQRSAAQDFPSSPLSTITDNSRSKTPGAGSNASRRATLLTTPSSNVRRFRAATFTLAQVIEVCGSRIRIRLVGTDDRNDCWFLVDSDQIRPYPSGEPLQPPFGYMHNHLHWSRTLKTAMEGAKFADPSWFVKPPVGPTDNFFQVGDKLEAVDRRNTQLICPATVSAVNGHHVLISFDGWSDFDYWTRFDSRELFPVGWCKRSGYLLQPPGPHALRSPAVHSTPAAMTPCSKHATLPSQLSFNASRSPTSKTPLNRSRGRTLKQRRQKLPVTKPRKNLAKDAHGILPTGGALSTSNVWERLSKPLKIIPTDSAFDYTQQSADSSMRSTSSPPVIHPVNEESSLNLSVSSSDHPPTIEAALPIPEAPRRARRTSSSSDCVVRLQLKPSPSSANGSDHSKVEHQSWEVVRTCSPKEKPRKPKPVKRHRHCADSKDRRFKKSKMTRAQVSSPRKRSELALSTQTGSHPELISNAKPSLPNHTDATFSSNTSLAADSRHVNGSVSHRPNLHPPTPFPIHLYCDDFHGSSTTTITAPMPCICPKSSIYPSVRPDSLSSTEHTDDELPAGATRLSNGQNNTRFWLPSVKSDVLGTKLLDPCCPNSHSAEDYSDGQSLAPQISSSTVSPSSLDLGPGAQSNPAYWTIDEVCNYLTTRDSTLTEVAEKFKHHEIDGQALLLLNMESLRNYLKIKLGPALKVDHLISRLKRGIL